jgi:hypothetical protein
MEFVKEFTCEKTVGVHEYRIFYYRVTITMDLIGTVVPAAIAAVALIGGIILLYKLTKSLLNIIAFMIAIALAYGGYLYISGQKVPCTKEAIIQHAREKVDVLNSESGVQKVRDTVSRVRLVPDKGKEQNR